MNLLLMSGTRKSIHFLPSINQMNGPRVMTRP